MGDEKEALLGGRVREYAEDFVDEAGEAAETAATTPTGQGEGDSMVRTSRQKVPWAAVLSALIGAFQFGYNTGVMNAPKELIRATFNVSEHEWDWQYTIIVSAFCVGGFIGALAAGPIASRYGRRPAIIMTGVVFTVSGILQATAKNYEEMSVGRLLVGIGSGIATTVVPTYITEVSPKEKRGGIGTLNQYCVTVAILVSTLFGFAIKEDTWWYLFGFVSLLGILQMLTFPFLLETMVEENEDADLDASTTKKDGNTCSGGHVALMVKDGLPLKETQGLGPLSFLKNPIDRYALFICIGMMASQQLSGINGVMYYSTSIFSSAGMSSPLLAACLVNGVNVFMTQVSAYAVDRAGRRILMLVGLMGMLISAALLTLVLNVGSIPVGLLTVLFTMSFVASFAIGPGAIPWFYPSELFESKSRPIAVAIAGGFNWIFNFFVGISFIPMQGVLGKLILNDASAGNKVVFVPFIIILSICSAFVYYLVPETKNRSVKQIRQAVSAGRKY